MTAGRLEERDRTDVDALVADRYLDGLLAAGERSAGDVPSDAGLDPGLRDAARVLRRSLVRVHPSFRFEERLGVRLAELAAAGTASPVMGGATVLPFRGRLDRASLKADLEAVDPLLAGIAAGTIDPADPAAAGIARDGRDLAGRRPLLVGGAITSAAISLVGVAWIAWRAARPSGRPAGHPAMEIGGPA